MISMKALLFRFFLPALLPAWLLWCHAGAAAGANLEEKTKYERALEQKVEGVLANLLGPNKVKVMITAVIDFSAKESVSTEGGKAGGGADLPFKWQDINKSLDEQELLPGFPVASRLNPDKGQAGSTVHREVVFPQSMVKRLTVSVVLNENVPEADAQKVRIVLTDMLGLDSARGDEVLMMRARFAPLWYTPEMMSLVVKYGAIALITIIGMGIVALGFLRMAGAVNNMADSGQPSRISMELGGAGALPEEPGPGQPQLEGGKAAAGSGAAQEAGGGSLEDVVFNVRPEKLEVLVRMLAKDEPADISLIAVHLPAELRGRFIAMLPPETATEVVANMAKVRFIDPDLISRVKDELERRLSGAVGGYDKVLEVVEKADLNAKKILLENLERRYPEVAVQVRQRVLLPGDLGRLEDAEFALLAGALSIDKWASAAWDLDEMGKAKLKVSLSAGAWKMMEQTMQYGRPPKARTDSTTEELLAAAWRLIHEGRIKNPNAAPAEKAPAALPAPGPAVAGPAQAGPSENKA